MQEEQYIKIDEDGNKFYYKNKRMTIEHRLDGPAIKWADGSKEWWVDGKRHRLDKPAVEWVNLVNGGKVWWVDGELHRLNGPAVEYAGEYKEWWVEGKRLSENEFNALSKTLELTLDQIAAKFGVDVKNLKIIK